MPHSDYQARVADQIAQYAEEQIHDHPPIYEYWSNTYLRPKLQSVLGVDSISGFYVEHIRERAARNTHQPVRILSVGAGDGELEVQIARELLSGGVPAFRLECLELSPILIDRANRSIREAGLQEHVTMVRADINSWSPLGSSTGAYTAVLANHILHHVVELEALFDSISTVIGSTGVFLNADMIGRNGHMRWPEALVLVEALWDTLPETLKYNHAFEETDITYRNWDCCSVGGFEGIRAQDILPLLVQRFQFEKFLGFGNLPEVFCNRAYGPNFDREIPAHTGFVDEVEQLNSLLLELGVIKPTMMFAVMSNQTAAKTRFWKNLSPQFCVRDPANLDLSPARQKSRSLAQAFKPDTIGFCQGGSGERLLQSGWSYAEEWGTWMIAREAVLEIPVPDATRNSERMMIRIRAAAFIPKRLHYRSFVLQVDDRIIGGVSFAQGEEMPKIFSLEVDTPPTDSFLLRIVANEEATPAEDGSPDRRPLGIGLVDIVVS